MFGAKLSNEETKFAIFLLVYLLCKNGLEGESDEDEEPPTGSELDLLIRFFPITLLPHG